LLDLLKPIAIDLREQWPHRDRPRGTPHLSPDARVGLARTELSEFLRKAHRANCKTAASSANDEASFSAICGEALSDLPSDGDAQDQEDQAHHQEQEEQEFRDARGSRSDPGKTKERSDQRDDEKNYCPT
jgi:hypothetical protein